MRNFKHLKTFEMYGNDEVIILKKEWAFINDFSKNSTKYKLKVYFDGDSKTISNDRITAHNVDYLGYYKSPFENRVIIVLQYQDSSYGEYSHNGGIITIGCDLDVKSWSK